MESLDQIRENPEIVSRLTRRACRKLAVEALVVYRCLELRLIELEVEPAAPAEDAVMTLEEASKFMKVSMETMRKWAKKPQYRAAVVVSKKNMLRFSASVLRGIVAEGSNGHVVRRTRRSAPAAMVGAI